MIIKETLIYFKTSQQRTETATSYHFSSDVSITVVKSLSATGAAQKLQPRECAPPTVIIPVSEHLKKYILTTEDVPSATEEKFSKQASRTTMMV